MTKLPALLIPPEERGLDLLGRLEALARLYPHMIYGEAAAEIRRLRGLLRGAQRPRTRGTSGVDIDRIHRVWPRRRRS